MWIEDVLEINYLFINIQKEIEAIKEKFLTIDHSVKTKQVEIEKELNSKFKMFTFLSTKLRIYQFYIKKSLTIFIYQIILQLSKFGLLIEFLFSKWESNKLK